MVDSKWDLDENLGEYKHSEGSGVKPAPVIRYTHIGEWYGKKRIPR